MGSGFKKRYSLATVLLVASLGSTMPAVTGAQSELVGKVAEVAEIDDLGEGQLVVPLRMVQIVGIDPGQVFYGDPVTFSLDVAGMQVPAGKGVVLWYNDEGIAGLITEGNPVTDVEARIAPGRPPSERTCASPANEAVFFHNVDYAADSMARYQVGDDAPKKPSMVVTYFMQAVCPPKTFLGVIVKIVEPDGRYLSARPGSPYADENGHFRNGSVFESYGLESFAKEDQIGIPDGVVDALRPGEKYAVEFSMYELERNADGMFLLARQIGSGATFEFTR